MAESVVHARSCPPVTHGRGTQAWVSVWTIAIGIGKTPPNAASVADLFPTSAPTPKHFLRKKGQNGASRQLQQNLIPCSCRTLEDVT